MLRSMFNRVVPIESKVEFGGVDIHPTSGGSYRAEIDQRGTEVTIECDHLEALKKTLLDLKKVNLSPHKAIKRMSALDYLRLGQIWHTRESEKQRRECDENLLFLGLIEYQVTTLDDPPRSKYPDRFPLDEPWTHPPKVTPLGSQVCRRLFKGNSRMEEYNDSSEEWIDDGFTASQRANWLLFPLVKTIIEDDPPSADWYIDHSPEAPDWGEVDDKFFELFEKYPLYRQLWAWHMDDRCRRFDMVPYLGRN